MNDVQLKENDIEGLKTLCIIKNAENFNRWMYETIRPFCSGEILEIGSGIGNISQFLLKEGYQITLSDIRINYCEKLRDNFSAFSNLREIICIDIAHDDFDKEYCSYFYKYDTIVSLKVLSSLLCKFS